MKKSSIVLCSIAALAACHAQLKVAAPIPEQETRTISEYGTHGPIKGPSLTELAQLSLHEPELERKRAEIARAEHMFEEPVRPTNWDAPACTSSLGEWRCLTPKPKLLAAGTRPPIIPSSWLVGAWFIDPANASGVASDSNSGTSAGAPLLTWAELVARWGTVSPWLAQNTDITILSTQPSLGEADPVIFKPFIRNGALVRLFGVLNATTRVVNAGTLTVSQAFNRNANARLQITVGGAINPYDLIVNATNPSNATIFGTSPNEINTPLLNSQAGGGTLPSEVIWSTGNTYSEYTQAGLNIVEIEPTIADIITTPMVVSQLNFLASGGAVSTGGAFEVVKLNGPMVVADNTFQRKILSNNGGGTYPAIRFVDNMYRVNGQIVGYIPVAAVTGPVVNGNGIGSIGTVPQIFGGAFFDDAATGETTFQNVWVDYDVLLEKGGIGATFGGVNFYGCVFVQSSGFIRFQSAYMFGTRKGACSTNAIIWTENATANSAIIYPDGQSYWSYSQGNPTATATFLTGVGLRMNNRASTGCSHSAGTPDVVNCGIPINDANLDAAQGVSGFGGYAFTVGGATYSSGQ